MLLGKSDLNRYNFFIVLFCLFFFHIKTILVMCSIVLKTSVTNNPYKTCEKKHFTIITIFIAQNSFRLSFVMQEPLQMGKQRRS